jgi:hypothetical protein
MNNKAIIFLSFLSWFSLGFASDDGISSVIQINNIEENNKLIGNVNYQTEMQDTMKLKTGNDNTGKIITGIFCGLAGILVVAAIYLAIM